MMDLTQSFERYLRNEMPEGEKRKFEAMLREDPFVQHLLEDEIENSDPFIQPETGDRLYQQIQASLTTDQKRTPAARRTLWQVTRWAAILLLPLISAVVGYHLAMEQTAQRNQPVTIVASDGEKAEATLADGTKVWLNSGSSLTYEGSYNRKQRNVYLSGEAYFEVAPDEKRPFIVKAGDMDIQALGTAFNVNAYPDELYASSILLEGKIKVTADGMERILEENERTVYDKATHTLTTDVVYAQDFVEWKNGKMYFYNQSFDEIAGTLSRVFNVEIRFESDELQPIRFTGTLGSSSIRNALDLLSLTSPMQYRIDGTTIELYHRP